MRAINLPSIVSDYPATETHYVNVSGNLLIAKANPARWSIGFSQGNAGGGSTFVSTSPDTTNQGIALPVGGLLTIDFAHYPGLVGKEWYFVNGNGLSSITVVESFMQPREQR